MTFVERDAVELVTGLQKMGLKVFLFQQAESRSRNRAVQKISDDSYRRTADRTGMEIIPLGTAVWDILTDMDPNYDFFAHDGSHASKKSAYMGACMIVNMLTGVPSAPPPADYDFTYSGMTSDEEIFLRQTAAKYTF